MANEKSTSGSQNSQPQFELIPASASADLAGGGNWLPNGGHDDASDRVDLTRFLHSLRRRWLAAAVIALPVSVAATFAFWLFLPRNYTTTAILRLASNESEILPGNSNTAGSNTFDVYKRTQRQLLRSRFVATVALRDEALAKLAVLQNEPDPVGWLLTNLSVTFPDESEVMCVSLELSKPDGVHLLVNAVVQAYFDEIVFAERAQKLKRLNSLDLAYKKAESELRDKRTEFKKLVDLVGTGDTSTLTLQQKNSVEKYAAVQQQSIKVRFELLQSEAELQFRQASEDTTDKDVSISEDELLVALRTDPKAQGLKAEKQQILDLIKHIKGVFKEGAVAGRLDEQTRKLETCEEKTETRKQELRQELIEHRRHSDAAGIEALERKIKHLTAQEKQLNSNLNELAAETRHIGKSSIDVEMMRTEIALLQDAYSRLGIELEHTRVELQPDSNSKNSWVRVSLLNEAEPARHVDSKGRFTKIIVGGIACLILPVFLLVWLDARKGRVNSGAEITQGLGLSVIGAVPMVPQRMMRRLGGSSPKQQYWRALLSESVDSIAAVLMRGAKNEGIRVVMVSSATAGEGKTTLAANLATSLAGAGRRTLLIDFDLRRPALHRVFDLALQPGINDVLRDLNAFNAAIQLTQIPNLAFLAAGRWSATGLAGLVTADLKSLFAGLRDEFEFVVVDGSPILPVVDTRLIAQNVDTVVISVLRDTSRVPQVRAACELLEKFTVPILGVVITGSKGDAYPDSTYAQYAESQAV